MSLLYLTQLTLTLILSLSLTWYCCARSNSHKNKHRVRRGHSLSSSAAMERGEDREGTRERGQERDGEREIRRVPRRHTATSLSMSAPVLGGEGASGQVDVGGFDEEVATAFSTKERERERDGGRRSGRPRSRARSRARSRLTSSAGPARERNNDRTSGDRIAGDRIAGDRIIGDRTIGDRTAGDRIAGDRTIGDRIIGDRTIGDRIAEDRGDLGGNLDRPRSRASTSKRSTPLSLTSSDAPYHTFSPKRESASSSMYKERESATSSGYGKTGLHEVDEEYYVPPAPDVADDGAIVYGSAPRRLSERTTVYAVVPDEQQQEAEVLAAGAVGSPSGRDMEVESPLPPTPFAYPALPGRLGLLRSLPSPPVDEAGGPATPPRSAFTPISNTASPPPRSLQSSAEHSASPTANAPRSPPPTLTTIAYPRATSPRSAITPVLGALLPTPPPPTSASSSSPIVGTYASTSTATGPAPIVGTYSAVRGADGDSEGDTRTYAAVQQQPSPIALSPAQSASLRSSTLARRPSISADYGPLFAGAQPSSKVDREGDEAGVPHVPPSSSSSSSSRRRGTIDMWTLSYFHGGISAADARDLLRGRAPGSFLVRTSGKVAGAYVVSSVGVRQAPGGSGRSSSSVAVHHALVTPAGGGYTAQGDTRVFPTVPDILAAYAEVYVYPVTAT